MASQLMYQLAAHTAVPLLSTSIHRLYSYYTMGTAPLPTHHPSDINEETDLDAIHMDRLLKWMHLVFEDTRGLTPGEEIDAHKEYKKELYSIYVGIVSDYKEYQQWKQYNRTLWLMSSYRKKNTKSLAKKILGDIKSFHEGLQMFSMLSTF
jgi:hypothetical protein